MNKKLYGEFIAELQLHGLEAMRIGFESTPEQTKRKELRLLRDRWMKYSFSKHIERLEIVEDESYDFLYKQELRISLKMQDTAFQRRKNNNGDLTVAPTLQMHNFQTKSLDRTKFYKPSDHCDAILVCQPRSSKNQNLLGFLPASVADSCTITNRKDQGQVKIENKKYEQSGLFKIDYGGFMVRSDLTKANVILEKMFSSLDKELFNHAKKADKKYQQSRKGK